MKNFIALHYLNQSSFLLSIVIGPADDPNCAKCDSRAVCIRLSNETGVSCVCLPGFALSSSTGRCMLQGKNSFYSYVTFPAILPSKERKTQFQHPLNDHIQIII